jgi:hypothetical protein
MSKLAIDRRWNINNISPDGECHERSALLLDSRINPKGRAPGSNAKLATHSTWQNVAYIDFDFFTPADYAKYLSSMDGACAVHPANKSGDFSDWEAELASSPRQSSRGVCPQNKCREFGLGPVQAMGLVGSVRWFPMRSED